MSFLDNFPYTNIHELNLDWMLKVLKSMGVKLDEYTGKVDALTDEVNNFIQNANIPGTVRDVLLEMYEDGRLADLVSAAVVAIKTELAAHGMTAQNNRMIEPSFGAAGNNTQNTPHG